MHQTFAQKLDRLFKTVTKPNGEEYSLEEIQVATNKAITTSYIYRLRTGKSTNPTMDKVKALTDFFGVDPAYFFSEDNTDPVPDPGRVAANIAFRAQAMDLKAVEDMLLMIKALREKEETGTSNQNDST